MNLIKKLKTSFEIRLSGDNRFLCHNTSSKTIVYDFNSWGKIIELNMPKHPYHMRFSKNNEYLLIKSTTGTICIYDTSNFQLLKTIKPKKSLKIVEGNVNFTQDNLILDVIETNIGQQIVSINFNTEEHIVLSEFNNPHTLIIYNHFLQKGNFHLYTLSYVNIETDYREYKILKVKEPLSKESIEIINNPENLTWDSIIFDEIYGGYILINNYKVILVDSDFKKILKQEYFVHEAYPQEKTGFFRHIHLSNNGKLIILTFSDSIFILRYGDLKTILVEQNPDNLSSEFTFAEFSNNGEYIFIGSWKNGYVLENNLYNLSTD